ncbi:alpha/beta-hydrolase [Trametes coccinea BRFM310]|uniref:Alpha/beta-hydrolase n=1 Tax=Trametes coccinea (strain BRFM310) TaxID=1353009 RepID=A0A1Y2IF25_TRAC3|nr:alpha/beta-hydrolase [Trametes coccinea BRFM310]
MDLSTSPTFPPPEPYELPPSYPKELVPIEEPIVLNLPTLPSPPRKSLLDPWFTVSAHLVPVANPRTTPDVPLPPLPKWSANKEEFKAAVEQTAQELLSIKERQWRGELDHLPRGRKPMWNCINRYVRKGSGVATENGVTLFFAHANGFPKEIWEPTIQRLVAEHERRAGYTIGEIWLWEARNHGDSALINREQLDGIFDWRDNTRDILHFLLHYLPTSASTDALPTHLPRLPASEASSRLRGGLQSRKMVYVGHSFGACSTVRAAIAYPILFKSIILVDAMILPSHGATVSTASTRSYVKGAIQRRDGWASRDEARRQFSATPFFAAWDPTVLDIYVDCGLYDAPDGQVKLKMPGIQEAVCFTENHAPQETFELLATLDERIELRWLVAGKLLPEDHELRRKTVWRRPANSSHLRMFSAGHLITQEAPGDLAQEIHEFLNSRYGSRKALL